MKKLQAKKFKGSYLGLFKQSLALSFSLFLFGAQSSYASTITPDSAFNTTVDTNGNIHDISGGIQGGNNTNILHFFDFNLSSGDIANLIFSYGANKLVGLVDNQIIINGILNALKDGTNGNLLLVSPEGMLVGQTGIINAGSLQLITPSGGRDESGQYFGSYGDVVKLGSAARVANINSLKSDSATSETAIQGKIFTSGAINLNDANKITIGSDLGSGSYSALISGFNANGFAKTTTGDLAGIVNTDGIVDSAYMTNSSGDIKIVSKEITARDIYKQDDLIQSTGSVTVNTTDTTGTTISLASKINAGNDVTIGNINSSTPSLSTIRTDIYNTIDTNGKISINGDTVYIGEDADITATGENGSVETNTSLKLTLNSDVTAESGVNIKSVNFDQGTNSTIKNTSTGNIDINAVNFSQAEGSAVINEGEGNIAINSPGIVTLRELVTNNGNVNISADNLTLNNTISSSGNIDIKSSKLGQNSNDFTALNAGQNITITTTDGNIGSESQKLKVSADGTLKIDAMGKGHAYLHGVGDKALKIDGATQLLSLDASSDGSIAISGVVSSKSDVKFSAESGIQQEQNSSIASAQGDIIFVNNTSGDISTGTLLSVNGAVNIINNAADGDINLNNNITANENIVIEGHGNITQADSKLIKTSQGVSITTDDGNVGSFEDRIAVSANDISVSATGAVGLKGENSSLDLSKITAGTDYSLQTTGDGEIIIGGDFNNANGSIAIETEKALNITDDITAAGDITLSSANGVVQTTGTIIESGLNDAISGNISITNTGDGGITINNATANKGGISIKNTASATGEILVGDLLANNGNINIINNADSGAININSSITTNKNINLIAQGNISQNTDYTDVILNAGENINLASTSGSVGANDNFITFNTNGILTAEGSDIYLESPEKSINVGKVTATNNAKIKTSGLSATDIILTDLVSGANLELNATGGILQNTVDKTVQTINATNDLSMIAQNTNVGFTSSGELATINFSSQGDLTVQATNGSIAINGINTSVDTSNINAGQNIDITTTGTGNIIVSNEQDVDGYISLNSAENIELKKSITATDDITLNAQKDVTQSADLTETALTSEQNINITAANAGTTDKAIIVNAQGVVNVGKEDSHAGNIHLADNTGDFTIGKLYADSNLSLTADGNIVQADNSTPSIYSKGDVTLESNTGNIGTDTNALKVNITGENSALNVIDALNVYVESPNSNLSTGDINAQNSVNIITTGSGNVDLKGLISSKDVTINTVESIIQNKDVNTKTINATNLSLTAQTGSIGDNGTIGNAILFSTDGSLSANASNGSIYLNGIETNIDTNTIHAKNDIDLSTTTSGNITVSDNIEAQGHIKLNSAQALTLNGNLEANDYVELTANSGNVELDSTITAGTDIKITSSGSIYQNELNNDTVLDAGRDISLSAGTNIGSESKSVILKSGGTVNASASNGVPTQGNGNINISTQNSSLKLGEIKGSEKISITANGSESDLTLTNKITGKDVTLSAGQNIKQQITEEIDRSIEAAGNLNLIANGGSIGDTGNAIDFSAGGSLSARAANSVVLNGIGTNIDTGNIEAYQNIDLSTEGSGKITVSSGITTTDGYIRLSSAESLELNENLSAGKHITLGANGGIVQSTTDSIITSGTKADVDAIESFVMITNQDVGDISLSNINAKGSVSVTNAGANSGNISLGSIDTTAGDINILNEGTNTNIVLNSLLNSSNDINLNANGSIIQNTTDLVLNTENSIELNATNIGDATNSIKINAENSVKANGTNIYLESPNKDLNIVGINTSNAEANGVVDIKTTTSGNILISEVINGGNVSVSSAQNINQTDALEKAINANGNLTLEALNGSVGSKDVAQGGTIKFSSNGNLSATASQAIVLDGIDTDITTNSISAGTDIDLKTTIKDDDTKGNIIINDILEANGYVNLNSAQNLDVQNNITATDYITLNTQNGNINLAADITSNQYIDVKSAQGIEAQNNILAGKYINLSSQNGNINSSATIQAGEYVNIDATQGISIEGNITADDYIKLNAQNGDMTLSSTIDAVTVDIDANGNINSSAIINSAQNINIDANGNIIQTGGSMSAEQSIEITSQGGSISLTDATAQNGSISVIANQIVNGDDTLSGDISVGGLTSANGKIILQNNGTDKNINLTGLLSATDDIEITSAGQIMQTTDDTTISTTKNVILSSTSNIGSDTQSILVDADETIKADGADIYLGSKNKALNIAGINIANQNSENKVSLKTDNEDIYIAGLINGGEISINSAKGISQDNSLAKSINGKNVTLTANDGNIGASGNAIDLTIKENGKINATASNSVYLNSPENDITTGNIQAGETVNINSAKALELNGVIEANDVILNAVNDISQTSSIVATNNVNITTTDGKIITDDIDAGATVDINSAKALELNGLIKAQDVNLTAVNDITQNSALEKSIETINLTLTSTEGNIGTPTDVENGIEANAIGFSATGTLSANASQGSAVLNGINTSINTGDITVNKNLDISTTGKADITIAGDINNTNGYISLNSARNLFGAGDKSLSANGFVSLSANQDIVLNSIITATTDIIINSGGKITQEDANNSIVLNAGQNIELNAQNNIGLSSKSIILSAGGNVDATGENIYLTSPDKNLNIGSIISTNDGTINLSSTSTTEGKIHLNGLVKGGNITVNAQNGITQNSDVEKSLEATEKLSLNTVNGDIGEAKNGDTPANAIDFSSGSLEVHADNGSAILNGVGTDINTDTISAKENIDLSTTESGDIIVSSELKTENGYINLNSANDLIISEIVEAENGDILLGTKAGDIKLSKSVTAGNNIEVNVTGNIIKETADAVLNAVQNIDLTATNDIGSNDSKIVVNAGNVVNAKGNNIYLYDDTNDFTIGEIIATNHADINAINNILQADSTKTGVTSTNGSISLTSTNGNIGADGSSIIASSQGVVNAFAENGNVYLAGKENLNTGTITAKDVAKINSDGNINIRGLITSKEINITAKDNITQNIDGARLQAQGGNINLESTQGNIGTPNGFAIGFTLQEGGVVNANAENNGSVILKGVNSDINTSTIKAKNDIDLRTTGTGNITVSDELDADGYINLDSANAINIDKNLIADDYVKLNAQNGDVVVTSTIQAGENVDITSSKAIDIQGTVTSENNSINLTAQDGDITVSSELNAHSDININSSGSIMQTDENSKFNAGQNISLTAGTNIGSDTNAIILSAGGEVSADGTNIYLTSPDANLTTGIINATQFVDIKTTGTGSITTDGLIFGTNVDINAVDDLIINKDITAQKELSLTVGKNIIQSTDSTISGNNDVLTITTNGGDIDLQGSIKNTLGAINITNNSTGNNFVTVNNIDAATDTNITNKSNGLITVGNLTNNGNSQILAENIGANSGVVINGIIDNKGSLNVTSNGELGTSINGNVNNNIANNTNITINNESGKLNINAPTINNGKNNTIQITNNGVQGIEINSEITNSGNLSVTNNDGELSIAGILNAEIGSQNSFTNNSDSDFTINSTVISKGTETTFANTGSGSLVLGEDAKLTVYSILDGANIYTGTLNLNNYGTDGNIKIDGKIFGLASQPIGYININNNSTGANSGIIFGETSEIDAQNNQVSITNYGQGGISLANTVNINSVQNINLINNSNLTGINFGEYVNITSAKDLNVKNTGKTGIKTNNSTLAANNLTVENSGQAGINIDENSTLAADNTEISNTGADGIIINGQIKGKNIVVNNENSNLLIAHNKSDGNIIAQDKITINIKDGDLLNTATEVSQASNKGLVSGNNGVDIVINNGNAGKLDSTLNQIIENGFNLDKNNAIHINTTGNLNADVTGELNILSSGQDLNIGEIEASDTLISTIDGSIKAENLKTDNLYLYAQGNNAGIEINESSTTGNISAEATKNISINSSSAMNANTILSNEGSVNINSDGNVYINEIAAAEDITVNVEDEKLTITTLGRVERNQDITPKTVNLTVKDAKRTPAGSEYRPDMSFEEINKVQPNSKLDIYHAYVQDKATLKADTITAQVYDISETATKGQKRIDANGNEATGFHNANKNGELLQFDIQGANYEQPDMSSTSNNPNYVPTPNDKKALNVHLTIGDSVDNAEYGAKFNKLYADYAFIDTVGSDSTAHSDIVLDNAIIGEKAIIRNNKVRLDITNTDETQEYPINIHYDDETPENPDDKVEIEDGGSIGGNVNEEIEVDTNDKPEPTPVNPNIDYLNKYNPHKRVSNPTIEKLTKELTPQGENNAASINSDVASLKNINWTIRNHDEEILGSSSVVDEPAILELIEITPQKLVLTTNKNNEDILKKSKFVKINMQKNNEKFVAEGKVSSIKNNTVEIKIKTKDNYAQNLMKLWSTEQQENL